MLNRAEYVSGLEGILEALHEIGPEAVLEAGHRLGGGLDLLGRQPELFLGLLAERLDQALAEVAGLLRCPRRRLLQLLGFGRRGLGGLRGVRIDTGVAGPRRLTIDPAHKRVALSTRLVSGAGVAFELFFVCLQISDLRAHIFGRIEPGRRIPAAEIEIKRAAENAILGRVEKL